MRQIKNVGFAIEPDVLEAPECDQLIARLGQPDFLRSRAGARHLFSVSFVRELTEDHRLLALAREVVGSEAIPFRVTLFDKSSTSN